MTIISSEEELRKALSLFKGQTCWNVSSFAIGCSLNLYFGKAVEEFVNNSEKESPETYFIGQYGLFFICSWRLDDENHNPFLSSHWPDYHEIKTTAISLIGETIESIEITPPVWETTVCFSSGKQLRAFCDCIPGTIFPSGGFPLINWWCDKDEESYYIGPGQEIRKSEQHPRLVSNTLYDPKEIDFEFVNSDKNYVPEDEDEEVKPDD